MLLCVAQELLKEWMVLEYKKLAKQPSEFIDACYNIILIARDGRQLVEFMLTMESLASTLCCGL